MSKKTGLYLMLAGAAVSVYDHLSGGKVYGAGAPLEKLRWKVATMGDKNIYISVSDLAAVAGAFFYFK